MDANCSKIRAGASFVSAREKDNIRRGGPIARMVHGDESGAEDRLSAGTRSRRGRM